MANGFKRALHCPTNGHSRQEESAVALGMCTNRSGISTWDIPPYAGMGGCEEDHEWLNKRNGLRRQTVASPKKAGSSADRREGQMGTPTKKLSHQQQISDTYPPP